MADSSSVRYEVEGARELAATLHRAGEEVRNMSSTNSAVGALVARNAAAGAPRRTGRLAASVRSSATNDRADITSSVVYAGVIHWGWPAHNIRSNPFATRAASATEPAWVDMYADQLDRILEGVRGI